MKLYGRSTVSEFLGDNIAYRNLNPLDSRLPSLNDLRASLRLPDQEVPRKTSPDYASLVNHLLKRARALEAPNATIARLIFIGDTRLNDATAFNNICAVGNLPGNAFICAEKIKDAPYCEILEQEDNRLLFLANRWKMLADFDHYLDQHDFYVDERTAIILDLDKTCLGARGRNDQIIDQARVAAAFSTARGLIGDDFDALSFEQSYNLFKQAEFHSFTADNQDYLVYVCLMVSVGMFECQKLAEDIRAGSMIRFDQFLFDVQMRVGKLPAGIRKIHENVYGRVKQGDPTPFKTFREQEYLATVARMGQVKTGSDLDEILTQEIVITQEVREIALEWRFKGALLFGLSDKPDEASIPSVELKNQGYLPIHRVETDVVGE